ncbi:unnamed protein product [Effrenium voratum]|nr:unnamed protein product [Effrenium voratum]
MNKPKALRRLRTMLLAIVDSFADLFWSFLVVILIVFVYGVFLSEAAIGYFDSFSSSNLTSAARDEAELVTKYFGSLRQIMLSLWAAVSGGNDWMTYGEVLISMDNSWGYFVTFVLYIAFCAIGLFNVVTGVFVDGAVEAAQNCKSNAETIESYEEARASEIEDFRSAFGTTDSNNDGKVSYNELWESLKHREAKAYWSQLNIKPEEATLILQILDQLDGHQNNRVDFKHFVNCARKFKGHATKIEMLTLMYDHTRLMENLQEEFRQLRALVNR